MIGAVPEARSFAIRVPDAALADLHARLAAVRFPEPSSTGGWSAGTSPAYLRDLVDYWRDGYDWRAEEARLARFPQFTCELRGTRLHFLHVRGHGANPIPLLLVHGFPDSFLRFARLVPLLDDFDLVIPSLPGYGFSTREDHHADLFHVADRLHELMHDVLGYARYGAHGGDWGSTIVEFLARAHAGSLVGIHLTDVPFFHALRAPRDASPEESAYLATIAEFQQREGAYAMIQGARGLALAPGLADSPAGLAAWLVDFFWRWSDRRGGDDLECVYTRDTLLANLSLYWLTNTIGSSFGFYDDVSHASPGRWMIEALKQRLGGTRDVAAAFAMFPKDLSHPPRAWAERFFDVARWTAMPRGGHFAALEEPTLLADDLRAFFRALA